MSVRTILLVRHAEAQKNVEDRHGGPGTPLTPDGVTQCELLARFVRTELGSSGRCLLVGHPVPHVEQTLSLLSNHLGLDSTLDARLKGIDLGPLAGLSRDEATERFPVEAARLEMWRAGKLSIGDLLLPDAEPVEHFEGRVRSALEGWLSAAGMDAVVAVCTRSTLIMLVNLVKLGVDFCYERYAVYDFLPASVTRIDSDGLNRRLAYMNASAGGDGPT